MPHHTRTQSTPHIQNRPVAWHSHPVQQNGSVRGASPIAYAPSHKSKTQYIPSGMYGTQGSVTNAAGMRYSHSAPVRMPDNGGGRSRTPVTLASVNEERGRAKEGSKSRKSRKRSTSRHSDASHDSEETYFVVPTPGQKVHGVAPDKSSNKSPTSPSLRKPFLSRLFGRLAPDSPKASSAKGSVSGRRLQRRHSTGPPSNPNRDPQAH